MNMLQFPLKTSWNFFLFCFNINFFHSYGLESHQEIWNGPGNYNYIISAKDQCKERFIILSSSVILFTTASCLISEMVTKQWRFNYSHSYTQCSFLSWLHFSCAHFTIDFQMHVWTFSDLSKHLIATLKNVGIQRSGKSSALHLLYTTTCRKLMS